jgi:flagellar hook assembly protein FlgD
VTVVVYVVRGALVRELVDETVAAGIHRVAWDGRDGRGRSVGSGIYFCCLEGGESTETGRMVLLR